MGQEAAKQGDAELSPVNLAVVIGLNILLLVLAVLGLIQSGVTAVNVITIMASLILLYYSGRRIYMGTAIVSGTLVGVALLLGVIVGYLLVLYIVGFSPMSYNAGWFIPKVAPGTCGTSSQPPGLFSLQGTPGEWIWTDIFHPGNFTRYAGCSGTASMRLGLAYWLSHSWNWAARPKKSK
jgi:hypothetical protein